MIRITVEVVPYGIEDAAHVIGEMKISNDGTGDINVGNYNATIWDNKKGQTVEAQIEDFPRKTGIWQLIRRTLNIYGDLV